MNRGKQHNYKWYDAEEAKKLFVYWSEWFRAKRAYTGEQRKVIDRSARIIKVGLVGPMTHRSFGLTTVVMKGSTAWAR